jgi:hypothetical protein
MLTTKHFFFKFFLISLFFVIQEGARGEGGVEGAEGLGGDTLASMPLVLARARERERDPTRESGELARVGGVEGGRDRDRGERQRRKMRGARMGEA